MARLFRRILELLKKIILKLYSTIDAVGYARYIGVKVGNNCRFLTSTFSSEPYLISIGDHVTLTGVTFITHDGATWVFREENPEIERFGPIKIGNNVFVGYGVIILPGVTIGDNCVIGAGSIVTKDIRPNSVAVGVPAKVIKTIDQYYESVKDTCLYTKSLKSREKRRVLEEKYKYV